MSEIKRVETDIVRRDEQPASIMEMMRQVVNRDDPQEMAGALEQLVTLKERVENRQAKQQFFEAFAAVQADLQTVVATMAVPDKNGNVRWFVAPFADILDAIEPTLRQHGFSLRFDSEREGPMLTAYCYAMHKAGHQESARCHFNAANAQGGDLGALTSAKRGALMEMFALKIRRQDDARLMGGTIDPDEVQELEQLIADAGGWGQAVDQKRFLAFAGATSIETIRTGRLPQLRMFLRKKIQTRMAKAKE